MQQFTQFLTGISRKPLNPDRNKVRRGSFMKGHEGVFWHSTKRLDMRKIVLAARRYEIQTKEKGKRNGALGHIALEVLDYLANLVDCHSGRLEPSLDTLMAKLHRSRDAIVRALKALRTHGFIDWLRRVVPTGNKGRGPKFHQTSNAYRISMPQRALKLLGRYGNIAPVSDDLGHAHEQQAADLEDMLTSLSQNERIDLDFGTDDPIGQSLKRLSLAMKERKSAKRFESKSKSISIGKIQINMTKV
tara:strand:- start:434 stop:1171 length:738 start_codon:yes stop_codon:yes gene_type:complete